MGNMDVFNHLFKVLLIHSSILQNFFLSDNSYSYKLRNFTISYIYIK